MRQFFAIAAAVSVMASAGFAQAAEDPPLSHRDLLWMLNFEAVKQDLKLDAQQKQAVQSVLDTMNVALPDLDSLSSEERKKKIEALLDKADLTTTAAEALARVLTPEQRARFAQLQLHLRDVDALTLDSVARELTLTEKQRQSIREAIEVMRSVPSRQREEARAAVWDVLTPEQQQLWEKLAGPRLDFERVATQSRRIPLARTTCVVLLRNGEVLKALQVSEQQQSRIDILVAKMCVETELRDSRSAGARQPPLARMIRQLDELTLAGLARILSDEQLTRFEQLDLQRRGIWEIAEKRTADRLGLTEAQRQKIAELKASNPSPARRRLRLTDEERKASIERGEKIRGEAFDVLTPGQKLKWKELIGPPMDRSALLPPPSLRKSRGADYQTNAVTS